MSILFTPAKIHNLTIPNRFVRSATAEKMADDDGIVREMLIDLYRNELVPGGTGLIITGHMYVHPSGKAHPEMTGIHSDNCLPGLTLLAEAVHKGGGLAAVQINHGGMQCHPDATGETIAPSAISGDFINQPAREMTVDEINMLIDAFGAAAGRVKQAGFDAVQIHAAHGYLINQFLSPFVNKRTDGWGGSLENRMTFLKKVAEVVRREVGAEFPVFIKLGLMDGIEGGLTLEEGVIVAGVLKEMGIDAIEISSGLGGKQVKAIQKGINKEEKEGYFSPWAEKVREVTDLPIILVGGFRSKTVMEATLLSGTADFISICRPLIIEPDLPNRFRDGVQEKSRCISANKCWPEGLNEGIACKCPVDLL